MPRLTAGQLQCLFAILLHQTVTFSSSFHEPWPSPVHSMVPPAVSSATCASTGPPLQSCIRAANGSYTCPWRKYTHNGSIYIFSSPSQTALCKSTAAGRAVSAISARSAQRVLDLSCDWAVVSLRVSCSSRMGLYLQIIMHMFLFLPVCVCACCRHIITKWLIVLCHCNHC